MNKIVPRSLLVSFIIILLLVLVFYDRSPFGRNNSSFAVEPDNEITGIQFSEGERRLTLEKKDNEWFVNDKSEARKSSILFILRVLTEIKIKSPVSHELYNTEITEKRIKPVIVKVFEKSKLIKSFLVYKTVSNTYGNIMKLKEGSKPFIVNIPGYEGEIGSAFSINELFWQPYIVFNLLPSQIGSISVENISDNSSSFTIINNNQQFILSDVSGLLSGWDTSRIVRYLSYYTRIPFETWAYQVSSDEKKKIESEKPIYIITVNKAEGGKLVLILWERWFDENGIRKKDSDRLWAKTSDRDELFIMRYFDVDPILKKKSYFYPD